jgi:acetyl esterase
MSPVSPQSLLTPAMRGLLERMARAAREPFHRLSPQLARLAYEAGAGVLEVPRRALARVQPIRLSARDGHAIPARLYAPSEEVLPVLVYFHGGGFTIGSPDTHDQLCRELSHHAHCAVVSVDYRLAPEHRFPVAVQDTWDALVSIQKSAIDLGVDGSRLAVGGDSAGGTLAAVCAIQARDAGLPLALQLLFYPGCGARQNTPSHQAFAEGFMLDEATVNWFFANYIAPADRQDWRFAPLNASDHDGLAPTWIGLAECDPLVDEGVHYADVLRSAGVPVDLEIYRGVVHGFIQLGRAIPEARQAHADAARALKAAFQP